MKKLMACALLCVGMQVYAYKFTIVRIGPENVVGTASGQSSAPGRFRFGKNFNLMRDREYAMLEVGGKPKTLQLTSPAAMEINISAMEADLHSPYSICIVNTHTDPVTISWHIDKDGVLAKQYEAREAALEEEFKKSKRKLEQEKDMQIQQIINKSVKSLGAAPGGAPFPE